MEKAKFTIEGYELKQLKMNKDGTLNVSFDRWGGKNVVLILTDEPGNDFDKLR